MMARHAEPSYVRGMRVAAVALMATASAVLIACAVATETDHARDAACPGVCYEAPPAVPMDGQAPEDASADRDDD
jgi:hypothetical protein